MVEDSRAVFFFEPPFDREAKRDVSDAWHGLKGFDPSDEFAGVAPDIEAGEPTSFGGRWESVLPTVLVDQKVPEHLPDLPHLAVDLREQYFAPGRADEEDVPEYVGDFADFVARCYQQARAVGHQPLYVLGADPNQLSALFGEKPEPVATSREGILEGDLEQLYWLQVFPPRMVERVRRDALLSAPAWRVEELSDGAVLLVAYANPHFPDFDRKEALEDAVGTELRTYWV